MIRTEKKEDRAQVATLIARTYGASGAEIIEQTGCLRQLDVYRNELSFVSVNSDLLEAYALCTPVEIEGEFKGVVLAPFALDLYNQEFDVMSFLNNVLDSISEQGFSYVFAMGDLEGLSPLGFVYADRLGFSVNQDLDVSLLVKDLQGETLKGDVKFPSILTSK